MLDSKNNLQLTQIQIKNFRCFNTVTLDLDGTPLLIEGNNGSGKTSLLEALHYLCYLRSFRTHLPRELIRFNQESFFLKAEFDTTINSQTIHNQLQVGFSGKKRLVKINQQSISSYRDLLEHYRIVTLTEDDLDLINQGPDVRRAFIDQAILLEDAEFIGCFRDLKHIVDSRNALFYSKNFSDESYMLWTQQLWHKSKLIQQQRHALLINIALETNKLLERFFNNEISIATDYIAKKIHLGQTWEQFLESNPTLMAEEQRFGRSLFGAHLDDFTITFQDKKSKSFASRGQQKLIVLLIKTALVKLASKKVPAVFLLDDFMTDFDAVRSSLLISILSELNNQLIFTSPLQAGFIQEGILGLGARRIILPN